MRPEQLKVESSGPPRMRWRFPPLMFEVQADRIARRAPVESPSCCRSRTLVGAPNRVWPRRRPGRFLDPEPGYASGRQFCELVVCSVGLANIDALTGYLRTHRRGEYRTSRMAWLVFRPAKAK